MAIEPGVTVDGLVNYRMSLLEKHRCERTLASIRAHTQNSARPSAATTWLEAGHVGFDGFNMTVSIDRDSMVDAGPGRMRVWIRYRNDEPNHDGVVESLVYEQLDCVRRVHVAMTLIRNAADGHVVSDDSGGPDDEEAIDPKSVLSGILPFTCAAHGLEASRP